MANFKGLRGHQNPVQTPEIGARIIFEGNTDKVSFLPFLGEVVTLTWKKDGQKTVFVLPRIDKGAVVCTETKNE
jgi:hypothetical protein